MRDKQIQINKSIKTFAESLAERKMYTEEEVRHLINRAVLASEAHYFKLWKLDPGEDEFNTYQWWNKNKKK